MSITSEDIKLIETHILNSEKEKHEYHESARYCFEMYKEVKDLKKDNYWIKRAMAFAVGILHPDYIRIFNKEDAIVIPDLKEGDCIRINAKLAWKLGFISEKGVFNHFLKDYKGDIYGISYYIPRLNMVGTAFLKDVDINKITKKCECDYD